MKKQLQALRFALEHIKEVQSCIIELNHDAMTLLGDKIFDADIEISEDGYVALQHQDILTQQLNATIELIEMINKHILKGDFESLNKNISSSLDIAKAKKDAFSGNAFEQKHEDFSELFKEHL